MAHERLRPQFLFDEEKIKQLKQLAPECFEDGKINFETLRQNLGDWAQDEEDKDLEHFGLFWPGKRDARRIAALPPQGTLEPVYGEGLKADGTPDTDGVNDSKNIFIEGENLEVLKILQKSYAAKIKMIYIDPPYNTGNDFVYDDNFTEPLQEYLRRTGQVDEEGKPLTTNKRSDGRFHSKWLSMMYPRLKLGRNLLRDDGVLFVSIDDNEYSNLTILLNEIFGPENFIGTFIIQSNPRGSQSGLDIAITHEYLVAFSKDISNFSGFGIELNERMQEGYNLSDKDGAYRLLGLRQRGGAWRRIDRPSLYYPIFVNPGTLEISLTEEKGFTKEVYPVQPSTNIEGSWRWSKKKFANEKHLLVAKTVKRNGEEAYDIFQKDYLRDDKTTKPKTIWDEKELNYQNGTTELKSLFDNKEVFNFPKPVFLLSKIFSLIDLNEGDIVMDYFAGSGTLGHAALSFSKSNEHIKFILVQIPDKAEYKDASVKFKNLANASAARVKKVMKKEKIFGLRYYQLKASNYVGWKSYQGNSVQELEESINLFNQSPLKSEATKNGILTEIMLLEGFALSGTIEKLIQYKKNEVVKVRDEYCEHSLLVCLDKEIKPETIKSLELSGNDIFICLDSAISNVDKLKLSDKGLIKTI